MRRFLFNNSHFLDQAFYAVVGLLLTMASAGTIAKFQFEHMPIEYQALARIAIMVGIFLMMFFIMYFSAKQSIRAGLGISSLVNQSLLHTGDSVYVKLAKPKKEFSGTINLENSSSNQFCITLPSGKEIIVPIQNIIKIFDEI